MEPVQKGKSNRLGQLVLQYKHETCKSTLYFSLVQIHTYNTHVCADYMQSYSNLDSYH